MKHRKRARYKFTDGEHAGQQAVYAGNNRAYMLTGPNAGKVIDLPKNPPIKRID